MGYEVIAVGRSYSGMAATLQLIRARRSVLVIDAGERHNRFGYHSHGFLGQEGMPPSDIATTARHQLEAYFTLTWLEGQVKAFTVTTPDGASHLWRRLLLSTGVTDGFTECCDHAVFHCPYCHSHELRQGRIDIVGANPMFILQGELPTDWGDRTVLVNGAFELSQEIRSTLQRRGAVIEEAPIDKIEGHADVMMVDERRLRFAGQFTATRIAPSDSLAEAMGCALEETPMGIQVRTDAENKTSVIGVSACGGVARAVGNGAMAVTQIHRSLLCSETIAPVQTEGHAR